MTDRSANDGDNVAKWRSGRGRIQGASQAKFTHNVTAARPTGPTAASRATASEPSVKTFLRPVRTVEPPMAAEVNAPLTSETRRYDVTLIRRMGRIPSFFWMVLAPVLATAVYLFAVATPLYEAQSVIAITKSSDAATGGNSGILGGMDKSSNLVEAFRADEYIKSQALMDSLEAEMGLVSEFSGSAIDPVRRLRTIPILSLSKHMQFDRFVESSIDVQSGLLKLYVRAPSEEQAIDISRAVLRNAEFQVSELGEQLFDNRETLAAKMRATAEQQVSEAQAELIALQLKYQEVDPRFRIENIYDRIKDLEDEAQRLRNEIQTAEISGVRNKTRTDNLIEMEATIRQQIADERTRLVAANGVTGTPLNNLLIEYELARLNVETAREAVKTAIEAQAETVQEAALNRSLFQVVVPPRTAQTPIYPKIPGVLALVFVICLTLFAVVHAIRENRS